MRIVFRTGFMLEISVILCSRFDDLFAASRALENTLAAVSACLPIGLVGFDNGFAAGTSNYISCRSAYDLHVSTSSQMSM